MSNVLGDQAFSTPRSGAGWRVVRIILTMIAMPAAVMAGFAPSLLVKPLITSAPSMEVQFLIYGLFGLFTAACYIGITWLLAHLIDRSTLIRCGLVFHKRDLLVLLGVTLLMCILVVPLGLILRSVGLADSVDPTSGLPLWVPITQGLLLAWVYQGFGEELLWRGYLLRHVQLGIRPAIWVSAGAFGVMHLISSGGQENLLDYFLYLVTPFGFAVLAGALAARLGSLWAAVAVHGGSHTAHLILTFLGVTDVSRGMWIGEGVICLAVALFVMRDLPDIPASALQANLPASEVSRPPAETPEPGLTPPDPLAA